MITVGKIKVTALLILITVVLSATLANPNHTEAQSIDIGWPFAQCETWYILQGYYSDPPKSHRNYYALDLIKGSPTTQDGTGLATVIAPMSGRVSVYSFTTEDHTNWGVLITNGSYQFRLNHLERPVVSTGQNVNKGDYIANVFNQRLGGYKHLDVTLDINGVREPLSVPSTVWQYPANGPRTAWGTWAGSKLESSCQAAYQGEYVAQSFNGSMVAGSTQQVQIQIKNTGTATWDANTRITALPRDDANNPFYDASWIAPNRIATPGSVAPGSVGTFNFSLHAPVTPGQYRIEFAFVQDGVTWFNDPREGNIWFSIQVVSSAPATPSDFRVSDRQQDTITLSWHDNANNETGYRIYRWKGEIADWVLQASLNPDVTSFTDVGLRCNQGYSYRLAAFNSVGETFADGSIDGFTTACPSAPATPSDFRVSDRQQDTITLAWQDNANNETGYRIYRWKSEIKDWVLQASLNPDATGFTDIGLGCNQGYAYRLAVFNSVGETFVDGWINGFTTVCPSVLVKPSDFKVSNTQQDTITLTWQDNANNETGYRIYRWKGEITNWVLQASLNADATSFTDVGLRCNQGYAYRLAVFNSTEERFVDGWIDGFTTACPSAPATPSDFKVSNTQQDMITLAWHDNANNETGYRIYRWKGEIADWVLQATLNADATSFTDIGLRCNQGYSYRLAVFNNIGEAFVDGSIDGFTIACPSAPAKPSDFKVTNTQKDTITLTWQDNANNEAGYRIYRWKGEIADWVLQATLNADATSYTDSDLLCNQGYYYRLAVFNSVGEVSVANQVDGVTSSCSSADIKIYLPVIRR